MKKFILCVTLFISFAFLSCNSNNKEKDTSLIRVGLVFDVGGRGDKSFNDAAYRGLEKAKQELGIEFEYIEPGPAADREAALRQFSNRNDIDVVFGIGFIFTDEITKIAQEFPDKKYGCIDYTVTPGKEIPKNLVALIFKEEEGSFLVGALAGLVTKTNKIGFVGGMDSPLIRKFEKAYTKGAKHVNSECNVLIGYAGITGDAFKNPSKGKELALGQYNQGADIIYHASGVTGLGVFEAARNTRKLAIGVDSDQYNEAPGYILTSMLKVVDAAVYDTIKKVKENTFDGGKVETFGLKSKGVDYVYNDYNKDLIGEEVHKKVEELRQQIIDGKIIIATQ